MSPSTIMAKITAKFGNADIHTASGKSASTPAAAESKAASVDKFDRAAATTKAIDPELLLLRRYFGVLKKLPK